MAQYQPVVSLAESPEFLKLQKLSSGYRSASRDTPEEELERFFSSQLFQEGYSLKEKVVAHKIVEAIESEGLWRVGEKPAGDDQLLQEPEYAYTIQPQDKDVYILSGIRGAELIGKVGKRGKRLLKASGKIAETFLEKLVLIGVAEATNSNRQIDSGKAYGKQEHGILHTVFIGGDFNGDFRMSESKRPFDGIVLDPSGEPQLFAPVLSETVMAYHSVEVEMAKGLLLHLSNGDPSILAAVKEEVIAKFLDNYDGRYGGNFGDYGKNDMWDTPEIVYDPENNLHSGGLLTFPLPILPQQDSCLELVSNASSVTFQNKYKGKIERSITVPDQDIINFIATMATANGGRTSPQQIMKVVAESTILPIDVLRSGTKW